MSSNAHSRALCKNLIILQEMNNHHDFPFRDPFSDTAAASITSSVSVASSLDRSNWLVDQIPAANEGRGSTESQSKHFFKSYQLSIKREKPWTSDKRMKLWKKGNYVIWLFVTLGLLLSAYINYATVRRVPNREYCLVLDDQFTTLDSNVWTHEVQIDGFGTGSFDWTTTSDKNSYVDRDGLHIVPTLTTDTGGLTSDQIFDGYSLNLTESGGDGSCTGDEINQCSVKSNATSNIIIPPIQSARLSTKGKKSIKYGRVEVVAKLPVGDWIWPAIWMMPEESVYGPWPRSGEIDIMESRGNAIDYELGGRDTYASTIHWGPSPNNDGYWRTTRGRALRRTDFSKAYHTFGFEWSEKYLYTYIDSRLQQVLYVGFDDKPGQSLWDRGKFAQSIENSTLLENPWNNTAYGNAPFDQKFFLILNVAVGSRNGWFLDNKGSKPWVDSLDSKSEFYKAKEKWLPTWGKGADRGMTVKSVKMWQEGKC